MKLRSRLVLAAALVCALVVSAPAFADSHGRSAKSDPTSETAKQGPGGRREPSAEDRAKMADAHQKMAECLRSDRSMKECRGEMKKAHGSFGHGPRCEHGESCPHGDTCDGSCKHHGKHGGKYGEGQDAMSTQGAKDKGSKEVDAVEPAKKKK